MRGEWTAACCTTWQWWVLARDTSSTDPADKWVWQLQCHFSLDSLHRVGAAVETVSPSVIASGYLMILSLYHWHLTLFLRMTCFLWRWEVSCITSASRELSKCSGSTTTSPTVCVAGLLMRFQQRALIMATFKYTLSFYVFISFLHFLPVEQHLSSRDFPVDQPPGDGVAALCGSGWIRSQPARQWCARRPDGKRVACSVFLR